MSPGHAGEVSTQRPNHLSAVGNLQPKGINVIHQNFYWNFTRATAKKIAAALNVKAIFSE